VSIVEVIPHRSCQVANKQRLALDLFATFGRVNPFGENLRVYSKLFFTTNDLRVVRQAIVCISNDDLELSSNISLGAVRPWYNHHGALAEPRVRCSILSVTEIWHYTSIHTQRTGHLV